MFGPLLRRSQPLGRRFRPAPRLDATAAVSFRCGDGWFVVSARSGVDRTPAAELLCFSVF